VLKGQVIGGADGWVSAAVHAPTSGTVLAIEEHVPRIPSGLPTLSVVIEPTAATSGSSARRSITAVCRPSGARNPARCRRRRPRRRRFSESRQADAPPGGAVEELVINGAECEPFMTCDDLLMRERAEEIVRGIAIFRDLLAARRVLIGIEDNKPEAVAAMQQAVRDSARLRSSPCRRATRPAAPSS
jgi:electron transport complex protein RnfC